MPDLKDEVERVSRKKRAANAVTKWLADMPKEDAVQVLQHAAIDLGLSVTVSPNGTPTPPKAA